MTDKLTNKISAATIKNLIIDEFTKDGVICSSMERTYDEAETLKGGQGFRASFKYYNDKIMNYHKFLKVLTGEKRANISETIPVIDFYDPNNTSMMYQYDVVDGVLDTTHIVDIPMDSTKTAYDYISEDDKHIINRIVGGNQELRDHIYNSGSLTSGLGSILAGRYDENDFEYSYLGTYGEVIYTPEDLGSAILEEKESVNPRNIEYLEVTAETIKSFDETSRRLNNYTGSENVKIYVGFNVSTSTQGVVFGCSNITLENNRFYIKANPTRDDSKLVLPFGSDYIYSAANLHVAKYSKYNVLDNGNTVLELIDDTEIASIDTLDKLKDKGIVRGVIEMSDKDIVFHIPQDSSIIGDSDILVILKHYIDESGNSCYDVKAIPVTSVYTNYSFTTLRPNDFLPSGLKSISSVISTLNKVMKLDKVYTSSASGLLNGLFSIPLDRTIVGVGDGAYSTVSKWKFINESGSALSNNVTIPVGTEYYRGHILGRGTFYNAPLRTDTKTFTSGDGTVTPLRGRALETYLTLMESGKELLKSYTVNYLDWSSQNSSTFKLDNLVTMEDYIFTEPRNSQMFFDEESATQGLNDGSNKAPSVENWEANVNYKEKFKISEREPVTTDSLDAYFTFLNESFNSLDQTMYIDLSKRSNGDFSINYSEYSQKYKGKALGFLWKTYEDIKTFSDDDGTSVDKTFSKKFGVTYSYYTDKNGNHTVPSNVKGSSLKINYRSPYELFHKKNKKVDGKDVEADKSAPYLLYPENKEKLPTQAFLMSKEDLGFEEGNLCTFYSSDHGKFISFTVSKVIPLIPSNVKRIRIKGCPANKAPENDSIPEFDITPSDYGTFTYNEYTQNGEETPIVEERTMEIGNLFNTDLFAPNYSSFLKKSTITWTETVYYTEREKKTYSATTQGTTQVALAEAKKKGDASTALPKREFTNYESQSNGDGTYTVYANYERDVTRTRDEEHSKSVVTLDVNAYNKYIHKDDCFIYYLKPVSISINETFKSPDGEDISMLANLGSGLDIAPFSYPMTYFSSSRMGGDNSLYVKKVTDYLYLENSVIVRNLCKETSPSDAYLTALTDTSTWRGGFLSCVNTALSLDSSENGSLGKALSDSLRHTITRVINLWPLSTGNEEGKGKLRLYELPAVLDGIIESYDMIKDIVSTEFRVGRLESELDKSIPYHTVTEDDFANLLFHILYDDRDVDLEASNPNESYNVILDGNYLDCLDVKLNIDSTSGMPYSVSVEFDLPEGSVKILEKTFTKTKSDNSLTYEEVVTRTSEGVYDLNQSTVAELFTEVMSKLFSNNHIRKWLRIEKDTSTTKNNGIILPKRCSLIKLRDILNGVLGEGVDGEFSAEECMLLDEVLGNNTNSFLRIRETSNVALPAYISSLFYNADDRGNSIIRKMAEMIANYQNNFSVLYWKIAKELYQLVFGDAQALRDKYGILYDRYLKNEVYKNYYKTKTVAGMEEKDGKGLYITAYTTLNEDFVFDNGIVDDLCKSTEDNVYKGHIVPRNAQALLDDITTDDNKDDSKTLMDFMVSRSTTYKSVEFRKNSTKPKKLTFDPTAPAIDSIIEEIRKHPDKYSDKYYGKENFWNKAGKFFTGGEYKSEKMSTIRKIWTTYAKDTATFKEIYKLTDSNKFSSSYSDALYNTDWTNYNEVVGYKGDGSPIHNPKGQSDSNKIRALGVQIYGQSDWDKWNPKTKLVVVWKYKKVLGVKIPYFVIETQKDGNKGSYPKRDEFVNSIKKDWVGFRNLIIKETGAGADEACKKAIDSLFLFSTFTNGIPPYKHTDSDVKDAEIEHTLQTLYDTEASDDTLLSKTRELGVDTSEGYVIEKWKEYRYVRSAFKPNVFTKNTDSPITTWTEDDVENYILGNNGEDVVDEMSGATIVKGAESKMQFTQICESNGSSSKTLRQKATMAFKFYLPTFGDLSTTYIPNVLYSDDNMIRSDIPFYSLQTKVGSTNTYLFDTFTDANMSNGSNIVESINSIVFPTSSSGTGSAPVSNNLDIPIYTSELYDVEGELLTGIASYIVERLEGTDPNEESDQKFVEFLPGYSKPRGRANSLYYKRYQALNSRLNPIEGPLARVSMFMSTLNYLNSQALYDGSIESIYKDSLHVLPLRGKETLVYIPKQNPTETNVSIDFDEDGNYTAEKAASGTTVTISEGKFCDKRVLDYIRRSIGDKCILTCSKCMIAGSCPYYNLDEVIKAVCPSADTLDVYVKDNQLDLLYYYTPEPDDDGEIDTTKISPYLESEDTSTVYQGEEDFHKRHNPYKDIIRSSVKGSLIDESKDFITLDSVRDELRNWASTPAAKVDGVPIIARETDNYGLGYLLGARYGTVSKNPYQALMNLNPDIDPNLVHRFTYMYDAKFIEDEETEVIYLPSDNYYNVTVNKMEGDREVVYKGQTKILIPSGLKILESKEVKPYDDAYIISDDTTDGAGGKILPIVYIGTVAELRQTCGFDLVETTADSDEEYNRGITSTEDTNVYPSDVAQWSMNIIKGNCKESISNSSPNFVYYDKDQYWMDTIYKKVTDSNGVEATIQIPGRKRELVGYSETLVDPNNIDDYAIAAGKPIATNYIRFLRKFRIHLASIKWVKPEQRYYLAKFYGLLGSDMSNTVLLEELKEKQKSVYPFMSKNLRLVVVKQKKWD